MRTFLIFIVALMFSTTAFISGIAPRLMPIIFIVFVLIIIMLFWLEQKKYKQSLSREIISFLQQQTITDPPALFFIFSLYLYLNSLWAYSFEIAVSKALLVTITTLILWLSPSIFKIFTKIEMWRVVRGILIGLFAGLLFLSIEFLFDQIFTKIFLNETLFSSEGKGVGIVEQPLIKKIHNSYFNNHIIVLNILFWPTLILTALWPKATLKHMLYGIFLCLIVMVTFLSHSETSKLALILGGSSFVAARYKPILLHNILFLGWIMSVILIIPFVSMLYGQGYQNSNYLPYSARHRIYIWQDTASDIMKNPIGGIGIRSSRYKAKKGMDKNRGNMSKGVHPHNIFLQSWYELGFIGTFFFLVAVLSLLQRIKHMTNMMRPYAYASFVSMSTIAAFGNGMWESWLMSGYSWSILFFIVAIEYDKQLSAS